MPVMPPSSAGLFMRLGGALVVVVVILILFVLPAEFHVDHSWFHQDQSDHVTVIRRIKKKPAQ